MDQQAHLQIFMKATIRGGTEDTNAIWFLGKDTRKQERGAIRNSVFPMNNKCRLAKLNACFGESSSEVDPQSALCFASVLNPFNGQAGT